MDERQLHQRVEEVYREINDKWLRFHLHLLVICALVGAILETAMFFIIAGTDTLNCTIGQYWLKYIIVPVSISVCITAAGYFVCQSKRLPIAFKQYIISFLFSLFAFVLLFVHSGFVAVLVCAIFPVLMTVMYENQRLTAIVTVFCVIAQLVSGCVTFWDPDKVLDHPYLINMIVLMTTTLCIWLTCCYMIRFMQMKRKIIIGNDIERYRLQEKINIDGLTRVGNKLALMKQLAEASAGASRICYLAMMDIDGFKKINDTYGHIFGDDVLRCVGDGMRAVQADADAFRYGGDEFCILFGEQSLETVVQAIKEVQEHLKCSMQLENGGGSIFISVGIARYSAGKTATELLEQADAALYQSKKRHGGHITVFGEESESGMK